MVGYGYKGPIVFFDSNDTSERTDWIYEAIATEQQGPQLVMETLDEEAQLMGLGKPSTCRHRCSNQGICKHKCCQPGQRPLKTAGNLTMTQYLTKIFHPYIEVAWQEAKDAHKPFLLLEDNDGSHGTKSSTNIVARYKEHLGIPWFANCPRSPDFNIIENIWRKLKQRVKQRLRYESGVTIDRLKVIITEVWDQIDIHEINKEVDSMPERLAECLRRKGLNTPF